MLNGLTFAILHIKNVRDIAILLKHDFFIEFYENRLIIDGETNEKQNMRYWLVGVYTKVQYWERIN